MRIVCDNCGTKYSISDDKVRGKLFKIRCKVCSHVIVVRGVTDDEADGGDFEEKTKVFDYGEPGGPGGEAPPASEEWFFVQDGQQAGPLSSQDVEDFFHSGTILADTYVWREGMEDWLHLSDIPEFAHLGGAVAAPVPVAEPVPAAAPAEDLHVFGGGGDPDFAGAEEATRVTMSPFDESASAPHAAVPDPYAAAPDPYAAAPDPHATAPDPYAAAPDPYAAAPDPYAAAPDPYAAAAPTGGSMFPEDEPTASEQPASGGLFSDPGLAASGASASAFAAGFADMSSSVASAPEPESPRVNHLVGARRENSVLFSLDTLTVAEGRSSNGSGGSPVTDGSGLIDIKALAATQDTASDVLDGMINISASMPAVGPAIVPLGHRQSNKLLYTMIGFGGVVIIGLVAAIFFVINNQKPADDPTEVASTDTVNNDDDDPASGELTEGTGAGEGETPEETEVAAAVPAEPVLPVAHISDATIKGNQAALGVASYVETAGTGFQAVAEAQSSRSSRRDDDERRSSRSSRDDSSSRRETTREEPREERRSSRDDDDDDDDRGSSSDNGGSDVDDALARLRRDRGSDEPSGSDDSSSSNSEESSSSDEDEDEADEDLPEQLTQRDIRSTIRRYNRQLAGCRDESNLEPGEVLAVTVDMTIQNNGRVASARSSSSDSAASCIVGVVRDMRFDRFSGESLTFEYPFRIR